MHHVRYLIFSILMASLAFFKCKKETTTEPSCGLPGTWSYSVTDPVYSGYIVWSVSFSETVLIRKEERYLIAGTQIFADTSQYTTNADCTLLTVDDMDFDFSINGDTLHLFSSSYLKN